MAEIPQAPADITPDDFYLKWIPEQAAANPDLLAKTSHINAFLQFIITGEGGGEYYLQVDSGRLRTFRGTFDEPRLTITQTIETWREIRTGSLNPQAAILIGKLMIKGNMALGIELADIMGYET